LPRSSRIRRWARPLSRLAILGLAALLLLELAIRWLLFSPPSALESMARRLQHAQLFAAPWEDDYWRLRYLFRDPARARRPRSHPLLGWHTPKIDPESFDHVDRGGLEGRRPLLLYGDSFAACVTPEADCWQGLLEASRHGTEYALLNYGTGGYGLDQTYLLARASLAQYVAERPLVVIGILVDDDLDRTNLRMRGWPKPYLVASASGRLELDEPVAQDEAQFLAAHPLEIRSYLWRYLVCGSGRMPASVENRVTGRSRAQGRTRERSRLILESLAQDLQGADVDHFVVLFHGPAAEETPPGEPQNGGWRESFLVAELERLDLPYVLSSLELAASRGAGLFVDAGPPLAGHYSAAGNRAVFGAFLRGIEGRFDSTGHQDSMR